MLGALFLAQDLYVQPATPLAEDVRNLFNITMAAAILVFLFVEGLLIYMIVKFRKNTRVPRNETHRGHTTAEVVWTVIPAIILLGLGFLSAGTLVKLDTVPDDTDFTIHVEASQFSWRFIYPDENGTAFNGEADWCRAPNQARCSFNELRIQEASRVRVDVTSRDVIHAFAVPEFSIKMDAVPSKQHIRWFEAPTLGGAATKEYFVQCMEYCGVGHHDMRAKITVFPAGSQPLMWGKAPAAAGP